MDERMRVVFFGSGAFGVPTLRALAARHDVRAVVTQPDRPAGRGKKLTPNPIGDVAQRELPGAELIKTERASAAETRDRIRSIDADAWVVIAFGQKLSPALLDGRFAVNLHASLLPRWRGAAPIHHAVLAGDDVTGNSVITLAERMDAGLVLAQSERSIEGTQTTGELHDLLAADGPELVLSVLTERARGRTPGESWGQVQDESLVTLASKLSREDAALPTGTGAGAGAESLRRLINGLSPWPGVFARIDNTQVKLLRAQAVQPGAGPSQQAATMTSPVLLDANTGTFGCADGSVLRVIELQPAGKRAMDWGTFARGRALAPGAALEPALTTGDEGGA